MPAPARLPRITCGIPVFDNWVEAVTSAVERALNVSGSGGVDVQRLPSGTNLSLNLLPYLAIAQSGSGGIPARSGSTLSGASVTLQAITFSSGNLVLSNQPTHVTAYNLNGTAVGANKYLVIAKIAKWWVVVVEVCS